MPDPNDPEFAPVVADLARLFLQHRADLRLGDDADDAYIVANVVPIATWLMTRGAVAWMKGDTAELDRLAWFTAALQTQMGGERAAPTQQ